MTNLDSLLQSVAAEIESEVEKTVKGYLPILRRNLDTDFRNLYGLGIKIVGLYPDFVAMGHETGLSGPLDLSFKYSGKQMVGEFFYKWHDLANLRRSVRGFTDNPQISVPLVLYSEEHGYTLTPYMGRTLKVHITENGLDEQLMREWGANIKLLKKSLGDMRPRNVLVREVTYNGPAITTPDPDKRLLFFDYDDYNYFGSKKLTLISAIRHLAIDMGKILSKREIRRASEELFEGYTGKPVGDILEGLQKMNASGNPETKMFVPSAIKLLS